MSAIITVIMTTCWVFFHNWWRFNIIKKLSRYSCSIFKSVFLVSQFLAWLNLQLLTATLNTNTSWHRKTYSTAYSQENKDERISKRIRDVFEGIIMLLVENWDRAISKRKQLKVCFKSSLKMKTVNPLSFRDTACPGFPLSHILTAAGPER